MVGAGTALALSVFNPGGGTPQTEGSETPAVDGSTTPPDETTAALPADEQCTDAIRANPRWVCITGATIDGEGLEITYDFVNGGSPFTTNGGFHVHFYGANQDGSAPPDSIMGSHASSPGEWYIEDQQPSRRPTGSEDFNKIADQPKVCARIAMGNHGLVQDTTGAGTFKTGNCWPVTRA
jgi:hypothetical protein